MRVLARRGFSLLEVVISTAIFTTVVVAFFAVLEQNVSAHSASAQKSDLVIEGSRAIDFITAELRQAAVVTTKIGGTAYTYPQFFVTNSSGSATSPFNQHAHAYLNPGSRRGANWYAGAPAAAIPTANATTINLPGIPSTVILPTTIPTSFQDVPVTGSATATRGNREIVYLKPTYATADWSSNQVPIFDPSGKILWGWSPATTTNWVEYDFVVTTGADGVLELQHRVFNSGTSANPTPPTFVDGKRVHTIARHCQWVSFEDHSVDATLSANQVRASLWLVARGASGSPNSAPESFYVSTVITMRNVQH